MQLGEIIFVDLHKSGQTVFQTVVEGVVKNLNIVQDKVHGASYLLVRSPALNTHSHCCNCQALCAGIKLLSPSIN